MKAIVLHQHGDLEQARFEPDYRNPAPSLGEVLVRVKAASINHHDLFTVRGMPGIRLPLPVVLGSDFAGEVAELGGGVTGWKVGERVLVNPINAAKGLMGELLDGGFAEFCAVDAQQLIRIPDEVSYEQAAALPVAYGTAYRMMHTNGRITSGEKVLVMAAAGGVGTCCVMLAKLAGCEVIACASSDAKLEKLRALGADHLINYSEVDVTKWVHATYGKPRRRSDIGGVDVIVNYTGGSTWVPSLKALKAGGRILTCGATAGFSPAEDLRYVFMHELRIIGSNSMRRGDLEALLNLVRDGTLKPVIDAVLPFEQTGAALRRIELREQVGKIVIRV
jgi:NADPH:quinone reductase-like Zn-dependent oxidoreductase